MPVAQSLKSCAALWNTNSSRNCQVKISTSYKLTLSPLSDYAPCTKFILREVGCGISLLILFRRESKVKKEKERKKKREKKGEKKKERDRKRERSN